MTNLCLTPNCHRQAAAAIGNGQCLQCYSKAKKRVESGVVTWEQLIEMCLVNPKSESIDPFDAALKKKLEENNENS